MEQFILTNQNLSKMCRLCLTSNVTMTDIYYFSPKLGKPIADKIMECTPIQITEHDQMPTCICQLCNVQLENFHQFQMQVLNSEKTLRRYLQRLHSSDKQSSSTETTVKCETVQMYKKNSSNATSQMDEEMSVKLEEICHVEIKGEPINDDQFFSSDLYTIYSNSMADTSSNATEKDKDVKLKTNEIKTVPDAKSSDFDAGLDKIEYPGDYTLVTEISSVSKESFQCNICEMNFNDSEKFEKHKLAHSKKKYQCDVCEKYFGELGHLKTHKLIHTGEKPHQCDVCKIRFRHLSTLRSHKLKHTGEKPYLCDICQTGFIRLEILKRHKLIHTGEKPHHCDVCKKCFRQINSLNEHKLTHTGEKPFCCDVCKRTFRLSQTLKKHKLIHTGEKPHTCDICKRSFRLTNHLKRHKQIHSLKKHKKTHTGEKPDL